MRAKNSVIPKRPLAAFVFGRIYRPVSFEQRGSFLPTIEFAGQRETRQLCRRFLLETGITRMLPLLRVLRKIVGWVDFIAFTALLYPMSWLPWCGTRPAVCLFRAWCRAFVRALDVNMRLHQKYHTQLPARFILIANHP